MLNVEEAIDTLLARAEPLSGEEEISLSVATSRILAEDIVAQINVPPADNSAMDGYAIRLSDAEGLKALPISQRIPAGIAPQPLAPETSARIFTGAEVPDGADTVIMQENTELPSDGKGDEVRFTELPTNVGENIRRAGQDIHEGEVVLKRGQALRPQELGLLASLGINQVCVFRRLRVAVLSTGSELVEPGTALQPGQIYNSNRPLLLSLIEGLGMEAIDCGICADDFESTKNALAQAAENADVVITSGGVSVGDEDHVKAAVESQGELDLWKVAIKPGKPFAFGELSNSWFIGLPGNPSSVFTTFLILARPFLLSCQGQTNTPGYPIKAPANFSRKSVKRQEYLRAKLTPEGLDIFPNQSSGVLSSACWGDGFAVQPIGAEIQSGDLLKYLPYSALLRP